MATARSRDLYRAWLEREGTATVLIYSGLVIVLLPAFHFILGGTSVAAPDSMELRLIAAAFSFAVAAGVILVPGLRRYAFQLQLLNVVPCLLVVMALIVNSGNNVFYVASGLLVVVALQQAFFRVRDIIVAFALGLAFQIAYSIHQGLGHDANNTIVIAIYASAYIVALLPATVNIRTREHAMEMRFEAEEARTEVAKQLARQTIITRIVEYIRSTFDLQNVIENVAQALGPNVTGDRVCVALWDDAAGAMVVKSEYRRDPLTVPSILNTELKSRRWIKHYRRLLAGQTLHISDTQKSTELAGGQREFFKLSGTKEFIAAPILAQSRRRLLGFIALGDTTEQGRLTDDDRTFLESIAGQVAIAIQQSGVYEQLQAEVDFRKRQEARLSDLANRDALTGIFNRRYFMQEVHYCVERTGGAAARGAVFFLDLDHFKIVNDTLGHDAGDRVLIAIPKVIRTALRESDLLARMGGDEFVVLLPEMKQTETLRVAEKIRKCIAGYSFREGGRSFDLGVSIGVALIDGTATPQELRSRADEACYRAKAEGRNMIELWTRTTFG
ncbi:MAG: sensor domain-containing diguanylate cyclase [Candidatus Eremiobacteraeota bacterium]|nr:sensor domain-containing diguanylate cyclase [Candidatus Eremiobacteraeota bacterium]